MRGVVRATLARGTRGGQSCVPLVVAGYPPMSAVISAVQRPGAGSIVQLASEQIGNSTRVRISSGGTIWGSLR
jgi:hypothetical protein